MTDTTVSDAVVFPQDEGYGVPDGSEDYISGGFLGAMARYADGTYVDEGMNFANVDTTNEQVDVTAGVAFIDVSTVSVQSGSQTSYDTTLPSGVPMVVVMPTSVADLGLGADTGNDLWLAVDTSQQDTVYIRHGSGLSAPTDPSVKLGTVDSSDGSTVEANRDAAVTYRSADAEDMTASNSLTDPAGVSHTGELADIDDVGSGGNVSSDSGRELYSSTAINVTVDSSGADYTSIQAAVDDIPFLLYDEVVIDVASGFNASTEDLLVQPIHGGTGTVSALGWEHKVRIIGDTTTPSNNPLGSVMVVGMSGGFVSIDGFELQNDNPHDNDNAAAAAYMSDSVRFNFVNFAGGTNGIISYGKSHVGVKDCDLGSNALSGDGLVVKHDGHIQEQRVGSGVSGNVGGHAYLPTSGTILAVRDSSTLTGDLGLIDATDAGRGGMVLNETQTNQTDFLGDAKYNFEKLGVNDNEVFVQSTQPSSPSTGDVWIDNG